MLQVLESSPWHCQHCFVSNVTLFISACWEHYVPLLQRSPIKTLLWQTSRGGEPPKVTLFPFSCKMGVLYAQSPHSSAACAFQVILGAYLNPSNSAESSAPNQPAPPRAVPSCPPRIAPGTHGQPHRPPLTLTTFPSPIHGAQQHPHPPPRSLSAPGPPQPAGAQPGLAPQSRPHSPLRGCP